MTESKKGIIVVQQTKESSSQSNVSWRVDPCLLVPLSHCKSQLRCNYTV